MMIKKHGTITVFTSTIIHYLELLFKLRFILYKLNTTDFFLSLYISWGEQKRPEKNIMYNTLISNSVKINRHDIY